MTTVDRDDSHHESDCAALLAAAHPELYRRNAFRVSGVHVEASQRDISRQVEKIQLMQKYGTDGVGKSPLAIVPPPDSHAIRAALHDLNDPERRLIDEFFWFWPNQLGQSKTDGALSLLAAGDTAGAMASWARAESSSEAYVSTHNLAVLHHCLALDLEAEASSRALSAEEKAQLEKHWDATARRWRALLGHEAFWSRLTNRIRALEDPRLTTGLARRIRQTLPQALLTVSASLAVKCAELGDFASAKRHVDVMRRLEAADAAGTGRLGPAATTALKKSLGPLRKRIRTVCEDLEARVDANPVQGDRITRELVEQTQPLLRVFDELLGAGDATRDAARDEVALAGLRCQIPYGNKTTKWRVCLQLLELIEPIAATEATKARIQENVKVVRGNVEFGACWFCEENDASAGSQASVEMYGDVNTEFRLFGGNRVTWRNSTVTVPRCSRCKAAHEKGSSTQSIGMVIGAVLGGGACVAAEWGGGGIIAVLAFGAIGLGVGSIIAGTSRPASVKPLGHQKEYPRVKMLEAMGWSFGNKPSNVR